MHPATDAATGPLGGHIRFGVYSGPQHRTFDSKLRYAGTGSPCSRA